MTARASTTVWSGNVIDLHVRVCQPKQQESVCSMEHSHGMEISGKRQQCHRCYCPHDVSITTAEQESCGHQ